MFLNFSKVSLIWDQEKKTNGQRELKYILFNAC